MYPGLKFLTYHKSGGVHAPGAPGVLAIPNAFGGRDLVVNFPFPEHCGEATQNDSARLADRTAFALSAKSILQIQGAASGNQCAALLCRS